MKFMKERSLKDAGFTLVELLVVIGILVILASIASAAYQGVSRTAREARTRSIIATIDSVLQEKYESYKYRPLAVEIPNTFASPDEDTPLELGYEALAFEAARVRLMMTRDLQRMEMPDRYSDISNGPSTIRAAANPVVDDGSGNIVATRDNPSLRRMLVVNWWLSGSIPSQLSAYRTRVTATATNVHQGAECLFLILSTSFIGGSPAIDGIPSSNIGDTDGDGMLEILDGWGRPIGFVRWPVGYTDSSGVVDPTVQDDFDLFRSDYAYVDSATAAKATFVADGSNTAVNPWSIRPLVFSGGSDGEFGIAVNPWTSSTEQETFAYTDNQGWPVNVAHYGTAVRPGELGGRERRYGSTSATYSSHPFPDPYLRTFVASNQSSGTFNGLLPGQQIDAGSTEVRADNITNYQLQASQ